MGKLAPHPSSKRAIEVFQFTTILISLITFNDETESIEEKV